MNQQVYEEVYARNKKRLQTMCKRTDRRYTASIDKSVREAAEREARLFDNYEDWVAYDKEFEKKLRAQIRLRLLRDGSSSPRKLANDIMKDARDLAREN